MVVMMIQTTIQTTRATSSVVLKPRRVLSSFPSSSLPRSLCSRTTKNGHGCLSLRFSPKRRALVSSAISSSSESSEKGREDEEEKKYDFIQEISDENLLTTSLNRAITDEDYELAAKLSKRLQVVQNLNGGRDAREILLDWRMLGVAEWMAARAEALGLSLIHI